MSDVNRIVRLRITLDDIEPPILRVVEVPLTISLLEENLRLGPVIFHLSAFVRQCMNADIASELNANPLYNFYKSARSGMII